MIQLEIKKNEIEEEKLSEEQNLENNENIYNDNLEIKTMKF